MLPLLHPLHAGRGDEILAAKRGQVRPRQSKSLAVMPSPRSGHGAACYCTLDLQAGTSTPKYPESDC